MFADVTDDMTICKEEIFGPVQAIQKFKTLDEAAERANQNNYGLAAAVFSTNNDRSTYLAHALRAGTIWYVLNIYLFNYLPFHDLCTKIWLYLEYENF